MVYADSSFHVAAYIRDIHTPEVLRRLAFRPEIVLTRFHSGEIANAIYRQVFLKRVSSADAQDAWNAFDSDCAQGVWIPVSLPERVWETSINLARRHGPTLGVRTLDSLHVACALELKADRFWTFDDRQARLAETVGLDTSA